MLECWLNNVIDEFFIYLVVVYSFFSHRPISIIQKHSKLWPFSSEYLYIWVLLKYTPHFYESLSFLSMLTEYAYNSMGYFRKKNIGGWEHGTSWLRKVKYEDFIFVLPSGKTISDLRRSSLCCYPWDHLGALINLKHHIANIKFLKWNPVASYFPEAMQHDFVLELHTHSLKWQ